MRGLTLRCPRCGSGRILRGWFGIKDDCPGCGLHFEREQGYWTGALAIHFVLTGGSMLVTLIVFIAVTVPNVPVLPTTVTLVSVAVVVGFLSFPVSKTLWMAIDRAFLQRLDHAERPDEQTRH